MSDEIEAKGLHTQQSIIASVYLILLPEAVESTKGKPRTLEGLYNGLCLSRRYSGASDRIFYCIVQLLSLNMTDAELQILKEQAALQPEAILNSKEIKFLQIINFLSYESKESLINANILPESARGSTKDAAELISGLIQRGHIASTSASLANLLRSVNNNEHYKERIKEIIGAPPWTAATARVDDPVEPDSPKLPVTSKSLRAVAHSSSGQTAPILKKSDTPAEQSVLGKCNLICLCLYSCIL